MCCSLCAPARQHRPCWSHSKIRSSEGLAYHNARLFGSGLSPWWVVSFSGAWTLSGYHCICRDHRDPGMQDALNNSLGEKGVMDAC